MDEASVAKLAKALLGIAFNGPALNWEDQHAYPGRACCLRVLSITRAIVLVRKSYGNFSAQMGLNF